LLGKFYTAPNGTANATCSDCEAGCNTCTAAAAGSCTSPAAGYYLNAGVPTACTALTADNCKADAALKIFGAAAAACPAGNICEAAPSATAITGVSVDANGLCHIATATGSPAGVAVPGTFAALVAAVVAAVRM
jgi:hypothetical protein